MRYKIPVSVLVVVHTRDLQVLLIERARFPGYWQSVTGALDAVGEPPLEAAARELREETGINAGPDALTDWESSNTFEIFEVWRHRYAPGVRYNVEHVFSLVLDQAVPVRLAPEHNEIDFYTWGARECCLPRGAVRATLRGHLGNLLQGMAGSGLARIALPKERRGSF